MSTSKLKVLSSDGEEFPIDSHLIKQSKFFQIYFDQEIEELIQLPHISSTILRANDSEQQSIDDDDDSDEENPSTATREIQIDQWDREFVKRFTVRDEKLFDMIIAANYLGITNLVNLFCRTYIPMIRGKTTEQIQELFKSID